MLAPYKGLLRRGHCEGDITKGTNLSLSPMEGLSRRGQTRVRPRFKDCYDSIAADRFGGLTNEGR